MSRKGFTLIELLVVISIIALLASVVLGSLNAAREKGRIGGARYFAAQVDHIAGEQAVGIWDFDECTGGVSADRSGFNNSGAVNGSPSWPTDTYSGKGCGLGFSVSTQNVSIADNPSLNFGTGDFTLALWVKNSAQLAAVSDIYALMSKDNGGGVGFGFALRGGSYNGLLFRTQPGFDLSLATPYAGVLSDGRWHHIVVTRNSGSGAAYIDGMQVKTLVSNIAGDLSNSVPFKIGSWSAFWLNGSVDDARVFSKALTALEVNTLYAAGLPTHQFAHNLR